MCLSMPQDNSAQIARRKEEQRQHRIEIGRGRIDNQFNRFNDQFYKNYQDSYLGNYFPQLDDQYADTRKVVRYDLARNGTLNSSTGINAFGKLGEAYNRERQNVASQALSAVQLLKKNISDAKTNLYNMNTAAADPGQATSAAALSAGALNAPPSFSPLGQVFAGIANGYNAYYQGQQNSIPNDPRYNSIRSAPISGRGSSSTVNT